MKAEYEIKIGLETHVELETKSKMFSGAKNDPMASEPNINLTPVCVGMPGTLPVPNIEAIKKTIAFGVALGCKIPKISKFDRKHYFYPDLPKGYQISQFDQPLCEGGEVQFGNQRVRLTRIHLEEDAGKLLHVKDGSSKVDLNRAGVPLMEIVSEPDITSAAMAKEYLQELRLIARHLKISQADMEKGQLRCDANVSISFTQNGKKIESYISEIKNLNSFRMVERAIIYEADRLFTELQNDEEARLRTQKMTVGWDNGKQKTTRQRDKEGSADYRYFPEPDIPPLRIYNSDENDAPPSSATNILDVSIIRKDLPLLPTLLRANLVKEGVKPESADLLVKKDWMLKIWQEFAQLQKHSDELIVKAVNVLVHDAQKGITADHLLTVTNLLLEEKISSDIPKKAFLILAKDKQKSAEAVIKENNWLQISDNNELKKVIIEVIEGNPGPVADYKNGKEQSIGFLVGQVMQRTKGQANPQLARKILQAELT